MSRLRANSITNKGANGAPTATNGLEVTGICTATDFSGQAGAAADFPNGLTGTTGTFSGNLNVAGVLTYEDVKNVDSLGVGTFRDGLRVVGTCTATSFVGDGSGLTGLPSGSEFNFGSTGITTTKNLGVNTTTVDNYETVGAANSFRGIYIGDGSLIFNARLDNINGYYIGTGRNALNAGPITLGSTMTLDGAWVIV